MPAPISVIYCYPRSGGTLLSQCLSCAKSTVVLSEINPAACYLPVERQAHKWFGLISAREAASLRSQDYVEKIAAVAERCTRRKKQLCVRDWVAINFIPRIKLLAPRPSGVLEQRWFLQEAGFDLREAALLRRSEAVFSSLRHYMPGFEHYSSTAFVQHYRAYLQAVADCPKFYLEDLTAQPALTLRRICAVLGLKFPPRFATQFHRQRNVTGNTTLPSAPPSASATRIKAAPAAAARNNAATTHELALFAELDALAGYPVETRP